MLPKAPHANCSECPLQNAKFVPTSGPKDAKVALVSRSPGQNDTTAPFTGPSGPVVDYLLGKYNHSRENVILSNVVLCQTESPSKEAIEACRPRLENDIRNCSTIIAAGTEAVIAFTNERSVFAARGYPHSRVGPYGNIQRIIAANNPAVVLRDSDSFPTLVTDFKLALDPLPDPTFPDVKVINDPNVAKSILQRWTNDRSGIVATDLEWWGTRIYCAGFSQNGKRATTFGRNVISDPECFGFIKRLYESPEIRSTWHNGKSDTTVLWQNGISARVDHDTFLLSYALDEEPGRHSLDYLLQTNFGWPNYEPDSVKYFKKNGNFDYYITVWKKGSWGFEELDEEAQIFLRSKAEYELYEYNGWDAAGTYQLFELLKYNAETEDVWNAPYFETLQPASDAFRTIELHGFRFDAEGSANIMEAEVLPALAKLKEEMREVSGVALLNPRGTDQMAAVYYDHFGLKHKLKDKAKISFKRSTGKQVREEIEGERFECKPGVRSSLIKFESLHASFAKIERQRSNYFQSLIERVDENGYIHPWFNLGGTVTGRTSSTKPNFQNITREGVEGIPSIRTLFLPSEGNFLIQADYSQAELRTMAYLSQDPALLEIYRDNTRSLHRERAAAFYGEQYTKEQYVKSKNINFGVSYWQSAAAFAQMYHMPQEEAQAYINKWWVEFNVLHQWTKDVGKTAVTVGVVVSPMGYKRRFHLITRDNFNDIQREGINFVPQNTAGALTIRAVTELVKLGVPVVNTVHDSIIVDTPVEDHLEVARLMKSTMEKQALEILGWDLPFTADVSVGTTWANVKETEL